METAACQASLSITNSRSSLRFMSIESVMPSIPLILCRPLLLLPPSLPASESFYNESTLRIRWPKYWSFSFSISSSNEYSGLISFRMDWLDLLAAAAAAKSLQSCPTLCDPIDGSPRHSPVTGILQARTLSGLPFPSPMHESQKWKWSLSVMSDSVDPMDCSPPGSSIHGIFQSRLLLIHIKFKVKEKP